MRTESGHSQGQDGSVVVPLGETVECTATNVTAALTLIKNVDGGDAVPSDFDIDVTPVGSNPSGAPAQRVVGKGDPGTTIFIRPKLEYRITEPTQADGYNLAHILCTNGADSAVHRHGRNPRRSDGDLRRHELHQREAAAGTPAAGNRRRRR